MSEISKRFTSPMRNYRRNYAPSNSLAIPYYDNPRRARKDYAQASKNLILIEGAAIKAAKGAAKIPGILLDESRRYHMAFDYAKTRTASFLKAKVRRKK